MTNVQMQADGLLSNSCQYDDSQNAKRRRGDDAHLEAFQATKRVCRGAVLNRTNISNVNDAYYDAEEKELDDFVLEAVNDAFSTKPKLCQLQSNSAPSQYHVLSFFFPQKLSLFDYLSSHYSHNVFLLQDDSTEYIEFLHSTLVVEMPRYLNEFKTEPISIIQNHHESHLPGNSFDSSHDRMSRIISRVITRAQSDSSNSANLLITRSNSLPIPSISSVASSSAPTTKQPIPSFSESSSTLNTSEMNRRKRNALQPKDIPINWHQLGSILSLGYRQINERSSSTLHDLPHLENHHPNTVAMNWHSNEWITLLERLDEQVLYHLLANCCVFKYLQQKNYLQISGPPLTLLYRAMQQKNDRFDRKSRAIVPTEPIHSALKRRESCTEHSLNNDPKRTKSEPLHGPSTSATPISNSLSSRSRRESPLRPLLPRSNMLYHQQLTSQIRLGLPNSRQCLTLIIFPIQLWMNNNFRNIFIIVCILV